MKTQYRVSKSATKADAADGVQAILQLFDLAESSKRSEDTLKDAGEVCHPFTCE